MPQAHYLRVRWIRVLVWIVATSWLSACSTIPAPSDEQLSQLLNRPLSAGSPLPLPTYDELFRLTPDMVLFAKRHVTSDARYTRIRQLTKALISPEGLALNYDATANGTAADVFETRRSNCLSFAILFMAFAQYLDLDAYANEVRIPQTWDVNGRNTLVTYRHVNVVATGTGRRQWVVDLNQGIYSPYYRQEKVSGRQLLASLYNNLGVEYMLSHQYDAAYMAYVASIEQNSVDEDTWSNLGNLMKRLGEPRLALVAYGQALRLAPANVTILSNLYELYREQGQNEQAVALAVRVGKARQRNPYYHYWQALNAYQLGEYEQGLTTLNYAISLEAEDHRFHFLRAVLLQKLHRNQQSQKAMEQAQALAPPKKAAYYPHWLTVLVDKPA